MSEVGRSPEASSDASSGVPTSAVRAIVGPLAARHRSEVSTEELIAAAVKVAREAGMSWIEIGRVMGISGQTTSERYGALIDQESAPGTHAQREDHAQLEDRAS